MNETFEKLEYSSESTAELTKALIAFNKELQPIVVNREGYGYMYADLDKVLNIIRPLLIKNNLIITQTEFYYNGKPLLATTLEHASGQWRRGYTTMLTDSGNGKSTPMQRLGSATTYARRYGICSLLGLSVAKEEDDDDAPQPTTKTYSKQPSKMVKAAPALANRADLAKFQQLGKQHPQVWSEITNLLKNQYGLETLDKMPAELYKQMNGYLMSKIKEVSHAA